MKQRKSLLGAVRSLFRSPRPSRPRTSDVWEQVISGNRIFDRLTGDECARLEALATQFLRRKQLYPVEGVDLTDDLSLTIAAYACIPILNLGIDTYRGFATIVLANDEFVADSSEVDEAGVVHEVVGHASGQVLDYGSIVLSVADVAMAGSGSGYNVVIHEMAHAIDRLDGELDGIPPLTREERGRWAVELDAAFTDFQRKAAHKHAHSHSHVHTHGRSGAGERPGTGRARETGASRRAPSRPPLPGHNRRPGPHARRAEQLLKTALDPYGGESPEEFFAVACETFFESPVVLRREYPSIYRMFVSFFRQDPALRPE